MPSIRHLIVVALAITACKGPVTPPEQNDEWPDRDGDIELELQEIASGVWLHTSWGEVNGKPVPSNGLVVRDGAGLILIDAAWGPAATKALLSWVESEAGVPVKQAIVTHFHVDRVGGTPVLERAGIPVLANGKTVELMKGGDLPLPTSLGELEPGDTVEVGSIEVFYPGPAHTLDNVMVYVPGAKLLYGGCAVRSPDRPGPGYTGDGDVEDWAAAIIRARDRYPDATKVVPGHGAMGDRELLEHTISLFQ